jgi:hypothetical protein
MLILVELMTIYCLNFLFCVQWVNTKGDCLFCWYWWNWWPLLCKLSFCVQWAKMRGDCLLCWYWWNWWPLLCKLFFVFSEQRWEVFVCFVDIGGIDDHYCVNFLFVFSELIRKVIVCFVDIGGIDDHYCVNFLFCVQWAKMRGDCLLCWYWWNWLPLLLKISFLCSVS